MFHVQVSIRIFSYLHSAVSPTLAPRWAAIWHLRCAMPARLAKKYALGCPMALRLRFSARLGRRSLDFWSPERSWGSIVEAPGLDFRLLFRSFFRGCTPAAPSYFAGCTSGRLSTAQVPSGTAQTGPTSRRFRRTWRAGAGGGHPVKGHGSNRGE